MLDGLRIRAVKPELMDETSPGDNDLREALRHLRRLNRIFGAAGPTLYGVKRLWRQSGKPSVWTLLDVGAGSGDVNRALLRWAERNGISLRIVLVDLTEEACEEAKALFRGEQRVEVLRGDLFALAEECADVVTATQTVHHFRSEQLPAALRSMVAAARVGVVINDIHRHAIPWAAVWLATRIVSRNRYIRHDGPLSVAKGFRVSDWSFVRETSGIRRTEIRWRPLFRYAITIQK